MDHPAKRGLVVFGGIMRVEMKSSDVANAHVPRGDLMNRVTWLVNLETPFSGFGPLQRRRRFSSRCLLQRVSSAVRRKQKLATRLAQKSILRIRLPKAFKRRKTGSQISKNGVNAQWRVLSTARGRPRLSTHVIPRATVRIKSLKTKLKTTLPRLQNLKIYVKRACGSTYLVQLIL